MINDCGVHLLSLKYEKRQNPIPLQALIDGIGWGLFLSILIGPIFFALIQAGIEQGMRAGLMVGLGIWISDFLFICFIYWGISSVIEVTEWSGFRPTVGVLGGIILIGFGLGTLLSKPREILGKSAEEKDLDYKNATYFSLWLKGFLVNTINPFTLLFWIGLLSTIVAKPNFGNTEALWFFTGILATIIFTDSLKVALAKFIRQWMTWHHILWMRRISGAAFLLFGIAMIVRVLVF